MNKQDFIDYLQEIKLFFGESWFQAEYDSANIQSNPVGIHPMVFHWILVEQYLNNKTSTTGINLIPKSSLLSIKEVAEYLRAAKSVGICDLNGNVLNVTTQDHFQNRLRDADNYYEALYELQIANLYLRKNYSLQFIHDTKTHPEFVININGKKIYAECKCMGKRMVEKPKHVDITLSQIFEKIEELLVSKKLGVIICCDSDLSNDNNWIGRQIEGLIRAGDSRRIDFANGYSFKIFPVSFKTEATGNDAVNSINVQMLSYINDQVKQTFPDSLTNLPRLACKGTAYSFGTRSAEILGCVVAAFRKVPNQISGIKKLIKKAMSQIPKHESGIVYIACPPYDASAKEAQEFWEGIKSGLNSTTRIQSLIITWQTEQDGRLQYYSNIIQNARSGNELPTGFVVLPLADKFEVTERKIAKFY